MGAQADARAIHCVRCSICSLLSTRRASPAALDLLEAVLWLLAAASSTTESCSVLCCMRVLWWALVCGHGSFTRAKPRPLQLQVPSCCRPSNSLKAVSRAPWSVSICKTEARVHSQQAFGHCRGLAGGSEPGPALIGGLPLQGPRQPVAQLTWGTLCIR